MYKIAGNLFEPDSPQIQAALSAVYGSGNRPLCMCKPPNGIEMYIAKVNDNFILKRMPHSGFKHAIACESYEPPAELSGRGEVMDGAIQTDMLEGVTTLKLDFALSKSGTKLAPEKGNGESDSVVSDGKKLTIRGLLHYLYDEAGLNRWSPAMLNKRNWWIVRKYLLEAASDKRTKGHDLTETLFIPESFSAEKKDEITRRRLSVFRSIAGDGKGKKLMLLVGELKELGDARFGKKMVIKHMPDCHFMMNEDIYKRFLKRYTNEMALWSGIENSHLLVIGTFSVSGNGIATIEEASVMLVDENWIPFENIDEKMLIEQLIKDERKFVKGLRYNLASSKVLASAVLSDTKEPVALYIVPYGVEEHYKQQLSELKADSELLSWEWDTSKTMPELPK